MNSPEQHSCPHHHTLLVRQLVPLRHDSLNDVRGERDRSELSRFGPCQQTRLKVNEIRDRIELLGR